MISFGTFGTGRSDLSDQKPLLFHVTDVLTENRATESLFPISTMHNYACFHHGFDWLKYILKDSVNCFAEPTAEFEVL